MKQIFSGTLHNTYGMTIETHSIYSTIKIKLFIIFLTAISFLSFSSVSAIDFNFESPSSVDLEKDFSVSISLQNDDIYDVKIFVHNSEDDKITQSEIISDIKNEDEWKSSWNYIISSFPDKKEYELKVDEYSDNANICVRLRKSGATSFSEQCKDIKIDTNEDSEEEDEEEIESARDSDDKNANQNADSDEIREQFISSVADTSIESEKISLNSKSIEEKINNQLITKEEKLRIYLIYAFSFFCLIIIFFLGLKKL